MALQINLDKACAICLQETGAQTTIFDCTHDQISIQTKIVKCFPDYEQVKYDYPDKICATCLEDLNAAYRFYINCEHTSSLLLRCAVMDTSQYGQVKQEANNMQNINEEDCAIEEGNKPSNMTQYEEYSEVEQDFIDYTEQITPDVVVEDIVIEETQNLQSNSNSILAVVKSESKDQVLKRFKSKIPKKNVVPYRYTFKTSKDTPTLKNTPKICEICGNSYKYQHALKAHMRRHLNDRPFKCEFCEKTFVSNVELRRHMRVHTGQKPYACSYCERCFSDFGSRIKHERTHTGERPFVCETCNKSFAYAHVLTVHLRTHTGEKKFKCDDCGRGFTKKTYLAAHMQQHSHSAEIDAKDKEIHNTLALQSNAIEESSDSMDKSGVNILKCSNCGEGFSKQSSMLLHMEQCNIEKTTIDGVKQMDNFAISLGDCFTAYIIDENFEVNGEQLTTLEHD